MGNLAKNDPAMLASIYHQYPTLKNVYGGQLGLYNVTPKREAVGKPLYGSNFSEFYQRGDRGGGDTLPNPGNTSQFNIEFYNPDAINNPEIRRSLTLGEMLHGMPSTPAWEDLRTKFFNNFSPSELTHLKQVVYPQVAYPNESFDSALKRTMGDAYLRAAFFMNPSSDAGLHPPPFSPPGDYWNTQEFLHKLSPAQQGIVQQMKQYLKGQ